MDSKQTAVAIKLHNLQTIRKEQRFKADTTKEDELTRQYRKFIRYLCVLDPHEVLSIPKHRTFTLSKELTAKIEKGRVFRDQQWKLFDQWNCTLQDGDGYGDERFLKSLDIDRDCSDMQLNVTDVLLEQAQQLLDSANLKVSQGLWLPTDAQLFRSTLLTQCDHAESRRDISLTNLFHLMLKELF